MTQCCIVSFFVTTKKVSLVSTSAAQLAEKNSIKLNFHCLCWKIAAHKKGPPEAEFLVMCDPSMNELQMT